MEEVIVFGHKSPDTDTICSAIVMADLQTKIRGKKVIPCRLGEINEETKFALKKFNAEAPKFIEKVEEGQKVILVDHNEFSQSVEGIENAKIEAVVDHHRINNFETSEPLFYYAQPVGCTSTILFELYSSNNIEIPAQMAGLMLSAIISDTLLLKSPTTTEKDKKALEALAKIADVDVNIYGLEMLKAGTNLDKYTEDELIRLDAKKIEKEDIKYVIAQVNTVSIPDILKRKEKIEQEKVLAYQNQYLKFLSEAQSQNIPNARAESIASYAMQHGLYSLPKCPICGSVDTSKIYMGQKMAKGAAFGLVGVADTAGKTWKCNKCGCKF